MIPQTNTTERNIDDIQKDQSQATPPDLFQF